MLSSYNTSQDFDLLPQKITRKNRFVKLAKRIAVPFIDARKISDDNHTMPKNEKEPLKSERPESFELDGVACCALSHSFAKHAEAVSKLMDGMDEETLRIMASPLVSTRRLVVPRNKQVEAVYREIAASELARLDKEEHKFHCKHSPEEHKKALESVVSAFGKSAN